KLKDCAIFWVNQSPPQGFGHAVLQTSSYIGEEEEFFVFAGDTLVLSERKQHIRHMVNSYKKENADIAFLMQHVKDPRSYGVVSCVESSEGVYYVNRVVEKPPVPMSDLAIVPIYIFKHQIFKHLRHLSPDSRNEIQLTDAIQSCLSLKGKVIATKMKNDELRL